MMNSPVMILSIMLSYFVVLMLVSWWTNRGEVADNANFFSAKRSSPWYLVAIGMIGASLSGVTFISIPGLVGQNGANAQFSYMQMVFGYLLGYTIIATVLMPIYYRLNLTSIYQYLEDRFGGVTYKTGAVFFLISRLLGSSLRLYLVAIILDRFVLGPMGVPFVPTVLITILLIWVYTSKGGIKTIVVTDVFQTVAMLSAVVLTIMAISNELGLSMGQLWSTIVESPNSKIFNSGNFWQNPNNFYKQFISGALIALVMTGLDQDMMQKNLTCRTLKDAQKNMFSFSVILVFANFIFLSLGLLLYHYATVRGIAIPERTDYLYPTLAFEHLPDYVGILFILGLTAAAYSSADSAMTALTTSVCVDILGIEKNSDDESSNKALRTRKLVHVGVSVATAIIIIFFYYLNKDSIINVLFKVAGYTYGPLLGLYVFGILTKHKIKDRLAWVVCTLTPFLAYYIDMKAPEWFGGFQLGFLNLPLCGLLTFIGLMLITKRRELFLMDLKATIFGASPDNV